MILSRRARRPNRNKALETPGGQNSPARDGSDVACAKIVNLKGHIHRWAGPKFTRAGLDCEGKLNQHRVVETWLGVSLWGEIVMTVEGLVIWLVIGAIAGWLAGLIMKGYGFGLVGNIVVGIVGAFIAGWLLPRIGFVFIGGIGAEIINAVIGAVILLAVIGLFKRAT